MITSPSVASDHRRVYGLDWLRVLLVFGVFLFHALHPYDAIPWVVKVDPAEQSFAITGVLMLFFPWGLPVLFLVAGSSASFAERRRDGRAFAAERVRRLLVPFLAGSVLLSPLQAWLVARHQQGIDDSLGEYLPTWLAETPVSVSSAMVSDWGWHLWFLGFLFAFSLLAWPIQRWLARDGAPLVTFLADVVERRRGAILLGLLPLVLVRVLLHTIAPEEHGWTDFAYYFVFYLYGIVLLRDERFLAVVRRDRAHAAVVAVVGVMTIGGGTGSGFIAEEAWEPLAGPTVGSFVLNAAMPLAAYGAGLVVIAAAVRRLDRTTPLLRYGQSVIVPFYVVHQPVVIAVAATVVDTDLALWTKVAVTLTVSLAMTMALVELIRRTPLSAAFGVKRSAAAQLGGDRTRDDDGIRAVPVDQTRNR